MKKSHKKRVLPAGGWPVGARHRIKILVGGPASLFRFAVENVND